MPLHITRRRGKWYPEFRFCNIFIVVAASPIELGIFGAGLQYIASLISGSWFYSLNPDIIYTI